MSLARRAPDWDEVHGPAGISVCQSEPHPLPTTVGFIAEGIKKLRAVRVVLSDGGGGGGTSGGGGAGNDRVGSGGRAAANVRAPRRKAESARRRAARGDAGVAGSQRAGQEQRSSHQSGPRRQRVACNLS